MAKNHERNRNERGWAYVCTLARARPYSFVSHQIWTKQIIQCYFWYRCRVSLPLAISAASPFALSGCDLQFSFLRCHVKINSPKRSISINIFFSLCFFVSLFSWKIHLTPLNTHKCHCTFLDEFYRLILWSTRMCTTHVRCRIEMRARTHGTGIASHSSTAHTEGKKAIDGFWCDFASIFFILVSIQIYTSFFEEQVKATAPVCKTR